MVAWALMEESLGDIGRTRQLLEIAVATQAGNPEVWNVSVRADHITAGCRYVEIEIYRKDERTPAVL